MSGPGEPQPLSVRAPAAWPLGSQVGSIAPRPASRHPSQFPEALRPAPTEPPARVSAPPASTVTTWWPFRPEARTLHDPASRPQIGAHRVYRVERHEPIAIPPAGPAPGPCALLRATECSWIRSRPRPASPALVNKSVPHGCNRAAVSLAPSESVPLGTRAVSPPRAVRWALQRPAHPTFTPSRVTSDPAQRVSACQEQPSDLPASRAFVPRSAERPPPRDRVLLDPIPTQARVSGTGNKSVPHGCNRAAVSLAPSESVPLGTRAVSPPRAVRWALQRPAHPTFTPSRRRAERPATQPSESQRAGSDHPTSQHRGPSSRARPSALHRAAASARVPIPTQARASATGGCGTGQHVGLGAERRSGGGQRLHSPTAWLPPGHEPGADGGVATTAQQQKGVAPRA
jgi:hypothetical protein